MSTLSAIAPNTPVGALIAAYWEPGVHNDLTPAEGSYMIKYLDAYKDDTYNDLPEDVKLLVQKMMVSNRPINFDALRGIDYSALDFGE